ncbi:MAG: efflux RND transporter periplasmic adaptor subunit [Pseudomonadota bacterium]
MKSKNRFLIRVILVGVWASTWPVTTVLAADDSRAADPLASEVIIVESEQEARGLINPIAKATISSEILARITKLPIRNGERFKKGALLVEFDCAAYYAELAVANADHERENKRLENLRRLASLSATSDIEVAVAEADVKKAAAEIRLARVNVSRCKVNAPYDGVVVERLAEEHESVGPQTEVLSVLAIGDPEIEIIVPSDWLRWIKKEIPFEFLIDETGERLAASLTRIGAVIDPVSQTIRVIGQFQHPPTEGIIAGMSGTAIFFAESIGQ